MKTQTYATEKDAKKAAERAYRPAILRLANGRYACFHAGNPLPQGARALSRWSTHQSRPYEQQQRTSFRARRAEEPHATCACPQQDTQVTRSGRVQGGKESQDVSHN